MFDVVDHSGRGHAECLQAEFAFFEVLLPKNEVIRGISRVKPPPFPRSELWGRGA